jgi:hypothetical protein
MKQTYAVKFGGGMALLPDEQVKLNELFRRNRHDWPVVLVSHD